MEFPDVHHKMSKKIAQLTKVIYHLNTRNDDNEHQMQQMSDMYECEIQDILQDAKRKIMTFKEQLEESRSQDKAKLAVQELTKIHDKEKQEMVNEFAVFRKKALENEALLKARAEDQIAKLTTELQTMRDAFASRCNEFEQGQKGLEQKGYDALGELRKLKDDEMEKMVQEYNEKYKAMLARQIAAQEELEASLNKQWQERLDAAERTLIDTRQQLGGEMNELKRRLAEHEKNEVTLKATISDLEAKNAELEGAIDGLKANERDLNQAIQNTMAKLDAEEQKLKTQIEKGTELSKHLAESQGMAAELERKLAEMVKMRDSLSMSGDEKQKHVDSLNAQIQNLTAELADKSKQHEAQVADLQGQLQDGTNETLSVKQRLRETEASWEATKEELQRECQRLMDAEAECARLQAQLKSEREAFNTREQELETTISDLERAVRAAVDDGESARKMLSQDLDGQVASLREEKAKALAELEATHKQRIEDLNAKHAAKIAEMNDAFAEEKRALADAHAKALREVNDALDAKEQELASKHARVVEMEAEMARMVAAADEAQQALSANASGEKKQLLDELAALRQQLEQTATDLGQSKAAASIAAKEAAQTEKELRDEIAKLKGEAVQLEGELDLLRKDKAASEDALRSQGGAQLDKLRREKEQEAAQRLELELAKLRESLNAAHEQKLARAEAEHRATMDAANKEFTSQREELKAKLAALEADVAGKQKEIDALGSSMAGSADAWKAERQQLMSKHSAKEEELKAGFAANLAALEAKLGNEKDGELAAQAQRHQQDLTALRKEHEAAVQELTAHGRRELEDARVAHADAMKRALAEKEEQHAKDVKRLLDAKTAEHDAALQRVKATQATAASEAEAARERLMKNMTALENALHRLRQELAAEKNAREGDNARAREDLAEADRAMQSKVKAMKERQANDIRGLKESQAQAIQKLTDEFGLVQRAMKDRNQQLEGAVAELEYKYANRESRDEDVERINMLMQQVAAKDEALVKAFNELRWYKLELVNREENYNKVFGRQPTVASGRAAAAPDASDAGGKWGVSMPSAQDGGGMPRAHPSSANLKAHISGTLKPQAAAAIKSAS